MAQHHQINDPLTEHLTRVQNEAETKENAGLKKGDMAVVIKGPFKGDSGKVIAIDEEGVTLKTEDGEVSVKRMDVKKS